MYDWGRYLVFSPFFLGHPVFAICGESLDLDPEIHANAVTRSLNCAYISLNAWYASETDAFNAVHSLSRSRLYQWRTVQVANNVLPRCWPMEFLDFTEVFISSVMIRNNNWRKLRQLRPLIYRDIAIFTTLQYTHNKQSFCEGYTRDILTSKCCYTCTVIALICKL